ncbi:MAG: universal stress protein, partial [Bdellovibrionota bacterium]
GGWVSLESVLNDEEVSDTGETEAKKWIERANLMGVEAQFVSEPFKELTSQAIVDYVSLIESRVPMLAMVSHTGPMAGWLLGSVTKDVIRRSPCPVYVT